MHWCFFVFVFLLAPAPGKADLVDNNAIRNVMGADYAAGVQLQSNDKHKEAVQALTKAINGASKESSPYLLLQAYQMRANSFMALKKYSEAMKDVESYGKLLRESPDKNDKGYLGAMTLKRAQILEATGKNKEALQSYKSALALRDSAGAHQYLGEFYKRQGQPELALAELRTAKGMMESSKWGHAQSTDGVDKLIKELESIKPKKKTKSSPD